MKTATAQPRLSTKEMWGTVIGIDVGAGGGRRHQEPPLAAPRP